jgi:hypothetical protein
VKAFLQCLVVAILFFQSVVTVADTRPASASTASSQPWTIRIEPVGSLKLENNASSGGNQGLTPFLPIAGSILSGALAFVGVWLGLKISKENTRVTTEVARENNEATIWQKVNEAEAKDIQSKIDTIYIPLLTSQQINHILIQGLREREPQNFRFFEKVFDKRWRRNLSANDKILVATVCQSAEEFDKLLSSKVGVVSVEVLPYIVRVKTYFHFLHLAFKGDLGDDPTPYRGFAYPRGADPVLRLEVLRLRKRLEQLRLNPGRKPPPEEPLEIPSTLRLPAEDD